MNLLLGVVLVAALCGYTNGAKCCYPPIWESLNFFNQGALVNGTIISVIGEEMVSVDTNVSMVNSMASFTSSGVTTSVRTIQDYTHGKQYQIVGDNCKVTTINTTYTNKCVPDDAHLDITAVFGVGANQLTFDVFSLVRNETKVSLDVAQPDCIPIAVNVYGSLNGGMGLSTKTYTNFTLGIQDRSVFTIPPNCLKMPVVQLPLAKIHVQRRSLPEVHGFF